MASDKHIHYVSKGVIYTLGRYPFKMRPTAPLSPVDMARALHAALLRCGAEAGTTFNGDEWEDRVIAATEMSHPQTIKSYTRAGRAIRLWSVEAGTGRGHKSKITLLAPRAQVKKKEEAPLVAA